MRLLSPFLLAVLSIGCSSSGPSKTQAECDSMADDIRKAAAARGIPADGVCSSANAQIQKDFGQACANLKSCQSDCCK